MSHFEPLSPFYISTAELQKASDDGCSFAAFLISQAAQDAELANKKFMIAAKVTKYYLCPVHIEFGALYECSPDLKYLPATAMLWERTRNEQWLPQPYPTFVKFENSSCSPMTRKEGNPALGKITNLEINNYPASDTAFDLYKSWMSTCLDRHQACRRPDPHFMPTRLLEIGKINGKFRLKLCNSNKISPGAYAALSYCWGPDKNLKTSSTNLARHAAGIDAEDLPQTLQDVVRVVDSLGLTLLWIDALCILQDDEHDKATEIATMDKVYANATVTVAASRAVTAQAGFLADRPDPWPTGSRELFELPYCLADGQTGSIVLGPDFNRPDEPLDFRAWAYQERLLSPRILDFGAVNTRWICCQSVESDRYAFTDGWDGLNTLNTVRDDLKSKHISELYEKSKGGKLTKPPMTAFRDLWSDIVQQYTARTIGVAEDRLLALGGVAKQFGTILDDDYKAGFWSSTLAHSLMWTRIEHWKHEPETPHSKYIAPSWSWASLNAWVDTVHTRTLDENFRVLHCHLEPLYKHAPYGALSSGFLRVAGTAIETVWGSNHESSRFASRVSICDSKANRKYVATMEHDRAPTDLSLEVKATVPVLFLIVASGDRRTGKADSKCRCRNQGSIKGLVLESLPGGTYRRVGCFYLGGMEMDRYRECLRLFRDGGVREFTIV
ncbi:hypothetical protein FOPE_04966 [Fonsecaea pedrosoi]|nr:hypothetical protein FOPE_04966 [Fonsecaea pedrosoi]